MGTMSENVAWSTSNILSEKKSSLDVHSWRLKPTLREIRPLDKLVNPIQHWLTKQLTKHYLQRKKNVASFLRDVISGKLSLKKRLDDDLAFYLVLRRKKHMYRKVANSSLSRLVARFQIFRSLMKGKFDAYVLWPLAQKFQNWIVDKSSARDFTVCAYYRVARLPIWSYLATLLWSNGNLVKISGRFPSKLNWRDSLNSGRLLYNLVRFWRLENLSI